jgi:ribosome-binding protein aMBF1 (putative translation factor)
MPVVSPGAYQLHKISATSGTDILIMVRCRGPVPDPRPDWVLARRRELGHRIAIARAARGWSLDDLAGHAGVARNSVVRAESASHSTGIDVLLQIADALGVTVGALVDAAPRPPD